MKKNILFLLLLAATTSATAAYNGRVFVDKNSNGQFDRGEKTLGGIKVSDGLNVTETAKDGTYTLPGHLSLSPPHRDTRHSTNTIIR